MRRRAWRRAAALVSVAAAAAALVVGCGDDDDGAAAGGGHADPGAGLAPSETPSAPAPPREPASVFDVVCSGGAVVEVAGELPTDLDEVSGVAASRQHADRYWAIEDSGNRAAVYGFGRAGDDVQTVVVDGVLNIDWEDIAVGPGPDGGELLWIADTGDNFRFRPSVSLLRFAEPSPGDTSVEPEVVRVTYEDGPRDAEALVVATTGVWLFEKTDSGPSGLYLLDEGASVFRRVGEIDVRPAIVTGADISADGGTLAIRTNRGLQLHPVRDGDIAAAVREPPCHAPAPPEVQGESVAFTFTGDALVTVSERGRRDASIDIHLITAR